MTPPIAHAGEEILIPLVPALIVMVVYWARARRAERDDSRPDRCPYCGDQVGPEAERCERCGFKMAT